MEAVRQRRGNKHSYEKQPSVLIVELVVASDLLSNRLCDGQRYDADYADEYAIAPPDNHIPPQSLVAVVHTPVAFKSNLDRLYPQL
jgi:hypothetical protein